MPHEQGVDVRELALGEGVGDGHHAVLVEDEAHELLVLRVHAHERALPAVGGEPLGHLLRDQAALAPVVPEKKCVR